jgi:hypothetical protein
MMVLDRGLLIIQDKRKIRKLGEKIKKTGENHVKSYLGQQHCSNFSAPTYVELRTLLRKMAPWLNKVHDKNALKL